MVAILAPIKTAIALTGRALDFSTSFAWSKYFSSVDKTLQNYQDRTSEFIHVREFGPSGSGVHDDAGPLRRFIAALNANPGSAGLMDAKTYCTSEELWIYADGVRLWGAGIPALHGGVMAGGTVIKALAGCSGDILTVSPVQDASHYLLWGSQVTGVGFHANSVADRGLMVRSVRNGKFDVLAWGDYGIAGVEFNVANVLNGTRDTQGNDVYIVGFITNNANGLICDGIESVANTSLNHFRFIDIYSTDGACVKTGSCDSNHWYDERYFVGGGATYSVEWGAGTVVYEGTRDDQHHWFAANKAAVGRTGVSPANNIQVRLDRANGTPDPVMEAGSHIYFDLESTPKYSGEWISYTPAITDTGAGGFTSVSATGKYQKRPNSIRVWGVITITTNGPANGQIKASVPVAVISGAVGGIHAWKQAATPTALLGRIRNNEQFIRITNTDGTYPGANGVVIEFDGEYDFDSAA